MLKTFSGLDENKQQSVCDFDMFSDADPKNRLAKRQVFNMFNTLILERLAEIENTKPKTNSSLKMIPTSELNLGWCLYRGQDLGISINDLYERQMWLLSKLGKSELYSLEYLQGRLQG